MSQDQPSDSNIGSNKVRLLALKTITIVSIIISAAIKYSQRQMAVRCEIFMHGLKSGDHLDKSELG